MENCVIYSLNGEMHRHTTAQIDFYWRFFGAYYSRLQNYDYYELAMGAIFGMFSFCAWNLIASCTALT